MQPEDAHMPPDQGDSSPKQECEVIPEGIIIPAFKAQAQVDFRVYRLVQGFLFNYQFSFTETSKTILSSEPKCLQSVSNISVPFLMK